MGYTKRPDIYQWGMLLAHLVATRSTCLRRSVGCVLLDSHNHVLATGYNGVAAKVDHCNYMQKSKFGEEQFPHACHGAMLPSGEGLDKCEAIHAEQNALLQVSDVLKIKYCFTTCSPCIHCTKLLLNTSCEAVFFSEDYPHGNAKKIWTTAGRLWNKVEIDQSYVSTLVGSIYDTRSAIETKLISSVLIQPPIL